MLYSYTQGRFWLQQFGVASRVATSAFGGPRIPDDIMYCLLYTSDAADE